MIEIKFEIGEYVINIFNKDTKKALKELSEVLRVIYPPIVIKDDK